MAHYGARFERAPTQFTFKVASDGMWVHPAPLGLVYFDLNPLETKYTAGRLKKARVHEWPRLGSNEFPLYFPEPRY
jgi:hypothetical protein